MNYEELLESVRNIEGEDAKEQIIAILENGKIQINKN